MQWYVLWFACLVSGGFGASLAVAPSGVPVQAPIDDILSSLDSRRLLDHLRFLGDADLEGRAPGTRGEEIAAKYVATEMSLMGLEPGGDNGSFIQQVPLIGTTVVTASDLLVSLPSSEPLHFQFGLDFVATTDMDGSVRLSASDTVFVGYGISAPDLGWDDYKDVDVSGKTLVVLVNQPRALEQPSLTYYGRWTYKFEEATRRGAQAVLLVHTNATAGYPWSVVISSNSGEQIHLSRALTPALHTRDVLLSSLHEDDNAAKGLELKGWISSSAAELMARLSSNGTVGLEDWFRWAENRSFAPVALNLTVSQQSNYSTRAFFGRNVVGVLGGASAAAHESVVVSGHIDHLGVRNGKVYPGYLDNASGASMVLTLAWAISLLVRHQPDARPSRSLVFLVPTGEESMLLGSSFYTASSHPVVPTNATVAAVNFDIGNAFGATEDVVILGSEKSELGKVFSQQGAVQNLTLSPDPAPTQGFFFRSDHFSFAKQGVPAVWVYIGVKFVGQDADYYDRVVQQGYFSQHYHQPSDVEYPEYTADGMLQQMQIAARVSWLLVSDVSLRPSCYSRCW